MRTFTRTLLTLLLGLTASLGMAVSAWAAEEWEEDSVYYEDDAWYDISEWFDGNDYNPTDESASVWNDETYDASSTTDSDQDNDWNYYGYNDTTADDNWYYDYYDYGAYDYWDDANDDLYESGYRYFDYDNDGVYDAYTSFYDWDEDGYYEDFNYYSFNDQENQKQNKEHARSQVPKSSRKQQVSGQIKAVKQVSVHGKKHLLVNISQNNQQVAVDLGVADELQNANLKIGDEISAQGQASQVGDKKIVLATQFQTDGMKFNVDRQRKTFQGKVANTHKQQIRGQEHLIAMIDTQQKGGKVAVDLGPADRLKTQVQKGSSLKFTGIPVKVKDQRLLMAQSIEKDGKMVDINRRKTQKGATSQKSSS